MPPYPINQMYSMNASDPPDPPASRIQPMVFSPFLVAQKYTPLNAEKSTTQVQISVNGLQRDRSTAFGGAP